MAFQETGSMARCVPLCLLVSGQRQSVGMIACLLSVPAVNEETLAWYWKRSLTIRDVPVSLAAYRSAWMCHEMEVVL